MINVEKNHCDRSPVGDYAALEQCRQTCIANSDCWGIQYSESEDFCDICTGDFEPALNAYMGSTGATTVTSVDCFSESCTGNNDCSMSGRFCNGEGFCEWC